MKRLVTLGTKVDEAFAVKVQEYCQKNGFTPSTLIRSLLEEELLSKKPLTSIYHDIEERFDKLERFFYAIQAQNLEILETSLEMSLFQMVYIKTQYIIAYKGKIPAESLKDFEKIDQYIKVLEQSLKKVREAKEHVS